MNIYKDKLLQVDSGKLTVKYLPGLHHTKRLALFLLASLVYEWGHCKSRVHGIEHEKKH